MVIYIPFLITSYLINFNVISFSKSIFAIITNNNSEEIWIEWLIVFFN